MLNFMGDFAVILNYAAFLAAFAGVFFYFKSMNEKKYLNIARISLHASLSGIIIMSFILLLLILNHQYQYIYVFNNSSNDLQFGLLASTFYAGQEGSFLFWLLCLAVIGIFLVSFTKKHDLEPSVMAAFGIILVFLLLLLINKTPFEKIWTVYPEAIRTGVPPAGVPIIHLSPSTWVVIPSDGNGLNPLLQNFWMQIHPPILFIGFSFMAVPFAFAVSALLIGDYRKWVKLTMPWLLIGSFFLGAGLFLGAFWAYETLGWGGYWGWDPVENSSLIPWIVGIALIHTLITQLKTGGLIKTNLFLAIITFVLVVYSTFLTRSGVLQDSSVHSFTQPGSVVYLLLFIFLFTILFLGVGLLLYRLRDISSEKSEYNLLSKEVMLSVGSIVLGISALIIFAGTSYPIFSKAAVDTSFYDNWNLPLVILMNVMNALSLIIDWNSDSVKNVIKRIVYGFVLALVMTTPVVLLGVTNVIMIILVTSCFFAIVFNMEKLIKNIKSGVINIGGVLSHIGVALFLLGVVGSGKYSQTKHMELPLGQSKEAFGYQFTYLGEELFDAGKKSYFNVKVQQEGSSDFILKPVMFVNQMANGIMKIPDINESITEDLYFSPVGIDTKGSSKEKEAMLLKGDVHRIGKYDIVFDSYSMDMESMMSGGDFAINAVIKILHEKNIEIINLSTSFSKEGPKYKTALNSNGDMEFALERVVKGEKPTLLLLYHEIEKQSGGPIKETLIAEISIKPAISLFWTGNLLMLIGFLIAYIKRKKNLVQGKK